MKKFDEGIQEYLESQDYWLCEDSTQFLEMYPPLLWGKYRPQPQDEPDEYPCMVKELGIAHNSDGADDVFVSILYVEEENK